MAATLSTSARGIHAHPFFKLGARPPVARSDLPRMGALAMMQRRAPPVLARAGVDLAPILGGNDRVGDCTSVALANHIRATAALAGFSIAIGDAQTLAFYAASTGYDPADPSTDRGGVEVEVLAYAQAHGYPTTTGPVGLVPLWGSVEAGDRNALALVSAGLTGGYWGLALAEADQAGVGAVWDTGTPASFGDPTPGSWGGHAVVGAVRYTGLSDADLVEIETWGKMQRATWRWVQSRLVEAHALLWAQLLEDGSYRPVGAHPLAEGDVRALAAANAAFLRGAEVAA